MFSRDRYNWYLRYPTAIVVSFLLVVGTTKVAAIEQSQDTNEKKESIEEFNDSNDDFRKDMLTHIHSGTEVNFYKYLRPGANAGTCTVMMYGLLSLIDIAYPEEIAISMLDYGEVYILELFGRPQTKNESPRIHYTIRRDVELALDFLESINCSNYILVAHSYSALIFTGIYIEDDLYQRYRKSIDSIRKIILISAPSPWMSEPPSGITKLCRHPFSVMKIAKGLGLLSKPIRSGAEAGMCRDLSEDEIDEYKENFRTRANYVPNRRRACNLVAKLKNDAERRRWKEGLQRVAAPVLLIAGEADRVISPLDSLRMSTVIPNATLYEIPDARHSPHKEHTAYFIKLVKRFISGDVATPRYNLANAYDCYIPENSEVESAQRAITLDVDVLVPERNLQEMSIEGSREQP